MRRVFHIVTHFDVGGAERVAVNIAKSACPDIEYHLVEVVRARTDFTATFVRELADSGIIYHRAHMPAIRFHYLFERLAALCFPFWFLFVFLRYRPDVIHSHTEVPDMGVWAFFSLFPWLRRRCRLVRTIHNTRLWSGMKSTGRRVERFMLRCGGNVAISEAVRKSYEREYGPAGPIIYNGLQTVARKPYGRLAEGRVNVLFAGRLEEQKGVATLVEIVRMMASDGRYFFHIIGTGSLEGFVRSRLAGCANVEMRPPLFGLASYMASFDYLLMPSLHEGLALLSIEASLAGLPAVINDCEGLYETLPDNWPLKVHDNSMENYKELFESVIPASDRSCLSATALDFARCHFSIGKMQRQYEAIYLS